MQFAPHALNRRGRYEITKILNEFPPNLDLLSVRVTPLSYYSFNFPGVKDTRMLVAHFANEFMKVYSNPDNWDPW